MANFYGNDNSELQYGDYVNFYGGNGNDILKGAGAANELYGGQGSDILTGGQALTIGTHWTGNGDPDDPITFVDDPVASGNDTLEGGSGDDGIYGFDGDDIIDGGAGNDGGVVVTGDGGTSYQGGLYGGSGNDTIYGGSGDDEIHGGLGQDELYGGRDADAFIFGSLDEIGKGSTADYIGDFRGKQGDVIDLSAIDANTKKGGDQSFKYIGDDKFTKPGQVSFKNGKVKINTDSDKAPEAILVVNTNKMDGDDFVL